MQLHRQLGISYNWAWELKHKLMQVMMERDQEYKLSGLIEIDDAYWEVNVQAVSPVVELPINRPL